MKIRFSSWPWIFNQNNFTFFFFFFDLQVTLMLPTKFQVNWLSGQEKKGKIDFQDGSHLGFPTELILAIFYQVTPMFPTKF